MRSREEQINDLSIAIEGCFNEPPYYAAEKIVLEAERRAEQRVRAEIGRDSERLDWLEKNAPDITMVGDGWGNRDHWHLVWADWAQGSPHEQEATSLREAIDAAREVG